MALKHVNAVIVGAGAGGGVSAKVLAEGGLSVVLLERGKWVSTENNPDDELFSQRTPMLGLPYGPDDERNWRVSEDLKGNTSVHLASEWGYGANAACVGSGTVSYGAMAWRFQPKDFKLKSVYGAPEGSALEDWPISYEELEPCYERAEYEIGVAGDDSADPFAPPRKKPYPMPPFPYSKESSILAEFGKKLGWHPFPIPMLRNSVPYGGRPKCIHMRACCGFACPINAKAGSQNTVIPAAMATGNCEVRTDATVSRIIVDDFGRATGVEYFDINGRLQTQTADIVIVAGAAVETARLLLNSKSKLFPNGAGNNHDTVGRCVQDHLYVSGMGFMDEEVYEEAGPGASVAFRDFVHNNKGFVGGGLLASEFIALPYLFSRMRPNGAAQWGLEHKKFQREMYKRMIRLVGPIQDMPMWNSRVTLDPTVKDHWGIPVARIRGERHPNDIAAGKFLAERAKEFLEKLGAKQVSVFCPTDLSRGVGQHQAGSCRMGTDPQFSVTDKWGRVHDIPNLFISDGSLHVTNGGCNPVLTIMALSYRVNQHIIDEWQKGNRFKG